MVQYQKRMRLENRILSAVFSGIPERFKELDFLGLTKVIGLH